MRARRPRPAGRAARRRRLRGREIEQLEADDGFADADAWWDRTLALAAPFTAALSNLPPESAQELEAKVKASGDAFKADDGSLGFPPR